MLDKSMERIYLAIKQSPVPITAAMIMAETKLSRATAFRKLEKLELLGRIEKVDFTGSKANYYQITAVQTAMAKAKVSTAAKNPTQPTFPAYTPGDNMSDIKIVSLWGLFTHMQEYPESAPYPDRMIAKWVTSLVSDTAKPEDLKKTIDSNLRVLQMRLALLKALADASIWTERDRDRVLDEDLTVDTNVLNIFRGVEGEE